MTALPFALSSKPGPGNCNVMYLLSASSLLLYLSTFALAVMRLITARRQNLVVNEMIKVTAYVKWQL